MEIKKIEFDRKILTKVLIFFILSRIFFAIIVYKLGFNTFLNDDGQHYVNIAQNGYVKNYLFAFFPLYPMFIKLLHIFNIPYMVGGILISNICAIITGYIFCFIDKVEDKNSILILWFFSPIAIFTTGIYTESLFILLTLLTLIVYKKEKYVFTGIFLGLSILTRNVGSLLYFAILIDMIVKLFGKKDIKLKIINGFKLFIPATLLAIIYPVYLLIVKGKPFYFVETEKYWFREHSLPLYGLFKQLYDTFFRIGYKFGYILYYFHLILSSLSVIIVISLLIFAFRKHKENLALNLFFLISFIVYTSSFVNNHNPQINCIPTASWFRYIFGTIPLYYYFSLCKIRKYVYFLMVFISLLVGTSYLSALFIG